MIHTLLTIDILNAEQHLPNKCQKNRVINLYDINHIIHTNNNICLDGFILNHGRVNLYILYLQEQHTMKKLSSLRFYQKKYSFQKRLNLFITNIFLKLKGFSRLKDKKIITSFVSYKRNIFTSLFASRQVTTYNSVIFFTFLPCSTKANAGKNDIC